MKIALLTKNCKLNNPSVEITNFDTLKIQPKTIDLGKRLQGTTTEFVGFFPQSVMLRSIVLCLSLSINCLQVKGNLNIDSLPNGYKTYGSK